MRTISVPGNGLKMGFCKELYSSNEKNVTYVGKWNRALLGFLQIWNMSDLIKSIYICSAYSS